MVHDELADAEAILGDLIDRNGRTTAQRINDVHRYGDPITEEQRDAARRLLNALLRASAPHGVGIDIFDGVVDLPAACIDAILTKHWMETRG